VRPPPPPLRFLAAVAGLWVCGRALLLAPGLWVEASTATRNSARAVPQLRRLPPGATVAHSDGAAEQHRSGEAALPPSPASLWARGSRSEAGAPIAVVLVAVPTPVAPDRTTARSPLPPAHLAPLAAASAPTRWSVSAWLLLREDRTSALAPGGTLGGSQTGLRLSYRLNGDPSRPVAVTARLYMPTGRPAGAEAALGLDWRPLRGLPVHLLAERRQALGGEGRSAFALSLHGGIAERPLPGGLRLDAYGQAGVVGARARDLFADGAARISLPVAGRVSLGAGIWGGAQPGAARLDAGPHASIRLPLAGESLRLSAEYRFRISGGARPASGPVLTLGSDF
jgi:hypothetical protein